MTTRLMIALAALLLCCEPMSAQSNADRNVQVMVQAARSLKFSLPEDKAYMLVKQETVVSEVAVIFGYADNRSACEQIAAVLSSSLRAGTFRCQPTY
jgi:hypothetical protein